MTVVSDLIPGGKGDIMRRLADLERQVQELAAGRRLEAATIKAGSLRVVDDTGALKVQVGLLPDGTYGLAAVGPSGELVALSTLAFGLKADTVPTQHGTSNGGAFVDLVSVGPQVPVTIGGAGRCIVILGCKMSYTPTGFTSGGLMGFDVAGPTDRPATVDESMEFSISAESGVSSPSKAFVVEGLAPGAYTITAKYRSAVNGNTCLFENRHLIVLPY